VATQTLMFLSGGAGGSAAMGQRLGAAYDGGVLPGHGRLIGAGLTTHGG
jgi:hypothetical protein